MFDSLKSKAMRLKREIAALYYAYQNPKLPLLPRLVILFTLGYCLSPIDLIPDFIPVLGYLDDLIILPALITLSLKLMTTIMWISAWKGYVQTTVYIHEKYLNDICALNLNKDTIEKIVNTKNIGKLKPCTFDIILMKDLEDLIRIAEYKLSIL